jgi:hypothetical protein
VILILWKVGDSSVPVFFAGGNDIVKVEFNVSS